MERLASSIILSLLLLCAGCSSFDGQMEDNDGRLLVNLDISVALSDISEGKGRAENNPADAANDDEKMNTLRIVIVRPDWTVEANKLIDLKGAAALEHGVERFKVVGDEKKQIYLFVNENTTLTDKATGLPRKLVDYDFDAIKVGALFPETAVEGLKIRLGDNAEQIEGPLPMSERHEYTLTKEPEQSCSLFVTRAAVKFTFHITNKSSEDIKLKSLAINKMAHEEWFMPRAEYSEPAEGTGNREIMEYEVPAGVGYYTHPVVMPDGGMTVDANGGESVMEPVYLLEGKYGDEPDANGHNYYVDLMINNHSGKCYLPNLPVLPRNTHVVVKITYDKYSNLTCATDVIPYSEVVLEPGFGL